MIEVEDRFEMERGCGWRKEQGLYLVSSGLAVPCEKLPIETGSCAACGFGIKPARSWRWINPAEALDLYLYQTERGTHCGADHCDSCPLGTHIVQRAGLLWVGEKHYPTTESFTREAAEQGVSRRIAAIPNGFEVGVTWVLFAHRKVKIDDQHKPAIFHVFRPSAIEYVVSPKDSEEKLERLAKRGITLVRVHRKTERNGQESLGEDAS